VCPTDEALHSELKKWAMNVYVQLKDRLASALTCFQFGKVLTHGAAMLSPTTDQQRQNLLLAGVVCGLREYGLFDEFEAVVAAVGEDGLPVVNARGRAKPAQPANDANRRKPRADYDRSVEQKKGKAADKPRIYVHHRDRGTKGCTGFSRHRLGQVDKRGGYHQAKAKAGAKRVAKAGAKRAAKAGAKRVAKGRAIAKAKGKAVAKAKGKATAKAKGKAVAKAKAKVAPVVSGKPQWNAAVMKRAKGVKKALAKVRVGTGAKGVKK
jgi:hypothetical protein